MTTSTTRDIQTAETDNSVPQSSSVFTEDIHVEDVAVFDTLDDADGNVDERILMEHI